MFFGTAMAMFGQNGNISMTEFTNFGATILALLLVVGAIFIVGGLIFAAFRFIGERPGQAAMGLVGAVFGGLIVGYAKPWASSLTGQVIP